MSDKTEELLHELLERQNKGINLDTKTLLGSLGLITGIGALFWNITTQEVQYTLTDRRNDSDRIIQLSTGVENLSEKLKELERSINDAIERIEDKTETEIEKRENLDRRVSEMEKQLYLLQN